MLGSWTDHSSVVAVSSIPVSSSPALTTTLLSVVAVISPVTSVTSVSPVFSSWPPLGSLGPFIPVLSALLSLLLSFFPRFLVKELGLDGEGGMVAGMLELLGSGFLSESDFKDGQEAFLVNSLETLLTRLPDINNFAFGNVDDLVKALNLTAEHLGDPEGLVHKTLSGFDGDEFLAFTKKESESTGDILA